MGQSWFAINSILLKKLRELINESLLPGIQRQLYEKIDFGFISLLRQQQLAQEKIKEEVYNFTKKIVSSPDGRKDFSGSYNAVSHQIVEKYIKYIC